MTTTVSEKMEAKPEPQKMTFGSTTVLVNVPTEAEVDKNIKAGQEALARLFERLQQLPGIELKFEKDDPCYYADPENPSRLIRILNGKKEHGVFSEEEGKFVVCE